MPTARTVLLAGATGLVGGHCLESLLEDRDVAKVIAPTRRPLARSHPKLENLVVNFDELEAALRDVSMDQVICCLGTTIKQAGSKERFRRVDHDYPLALARAAKAASASHYLVVTATGADESSPIFYNRVKGELERDLRALGFFGLIIARPSLLLGERAQKRLGESLAEPVAKLLPLKWRAIPARVVAQALCALARERPEGVRVLPSKELWDWA